MKVGPAAAISRKYRMVASAVGPSPSQIMAASDAALGAVVHEEFNGKAIPVLVLDNESFEQALAARSAQLRLDGTVVLHD